MADERITRCGLFFNFTLSLKLNLINGFFNRQGRQETQRKPWRLLAPIAVKIETVKIPVSRRETKWMFDVG